MEPAFCIPKVLGVHIGGENVSNEDMEQICVKINAIREDIRLLDCLVEELVLQRNCLNVSKANYLLRCNGDLISDHYLQKFDCGMAAGLLQALWGR